MRTWGRPSWWDPALRHAMGEGSPSVVRGSPPAHVGGTLAVNSALAEAGGGTARIRPEPRALAPLRCARFAPLRQPCHRATIAYTRTPSHAYARLGWARRLIAWREVQRCTTDANTKERQYASSSSSVSSAVSSSVVPCSGEADAKWRLCHSLPSDAVYRQSVA